MAAASIAAGVAQEPITPPVGIPLLGPEAPSTGVHDDLFARVLVLDDATQRVALICLDLIGIGLALADELRSAVCQSAGVASALINCSHTHSAPFTIPWSVQGWDNFAWNWQGWRDEVVETVAATAARAADDLQPAALRAGRSPAQAGMNRRLPQDAGITMAPNPDGAVVPWVDVLRVDTVDGRRLAVLFSHAAHPVIIHGSSSLISADFPAFATTTIREHFGGEALPLFAQGCCGNINGEPLRGGLEEAERVGRTLGEAAICAAESARPLEASAMRFASRDLALPLRDWPARPDVERAVAEAEARLAAAEHERNPDDRAPWALRETPLCLRDMLRRMDIGGPPPLRSEVSALALGHEWCLIAMPHEVFAEYQLWADDESPFAHTMVWAYTNGCESYVPTDAALELGPAAGYEAACFPSGGAGLMYPNRVPLRVGVEGRIRQAIAEAFAAAR